MSVPGELGFGIKGCSHKQGYFCALGILCQQLKRTSASSDPWEFSQNMCFLNKNPSCGSHCIPPSFCDQRESSGNPQARCFWTEKTTVPGIVGVTVNNLVVLLHWSDSYHWICIISLNFLLKRWTNKMFGLQHLAASFLLAFLTIL